jgi:hypothetical protein
MDTEVRKPIKLFYSYAQVERDEMLLTQLEAHLKILERSGWITKWHRQEISAGSNWEQQIKEHLNSAQIILLLISPDFMNSDYCYSIEMKRAMERHEAGEARVIPVLLRPCYYAGALFERLKIAPSNGKPVTSWSNLDEAFAEVTKEISEAVNELLSPANLLSKDKQSETNHELVAVEETIYNTRFLVKPSVDLSTGRTSRRTVFISFTPKNFGLVSQIRIYLETTLNADVYIAEHDAPLGINLAQDIVDAVWKRDTILALWTKDTQGRRWVRFEATLAYAIGKHMIIIKLDDADDIPSYLHQSKHLNISKYQNVQEALDDLIRHLQAKMPQYEVSTALTEHAQTEIYSMSEDEDDFYRFAIQMLRSPDQHSIIFTAGTPALILPSEIYTHPRQEYTELLLDQLSQPDYLKDAYYLFNYRKTKTHLHSEYPVEVRNRLQRVKHTLNETSARIYGLKSSLSYLPSGILSDQVGAILLRDPYAHNRLIGVYFVQGRELDTLRKRLYLPSINPRTIYTEKQWVEMLSQVGFKASIDNDTSSS